MSDQKNKKVADIGSERAVLSGICQYGNKAYIDVADIISVDTFTVENNKALFRCLSDLLKEVEQIDITSVIAKANELHVDSLVCKEKIDIEYLRSLFNFPLLLENVRNHAARIAKLEIVRKAQTKHVEAYKALQDMTGSESIDQILSTSEKPIFDLIDEISTAKQNQPVMFGTDIENHIDNLKNNPCHNIGLPSPFPRYNSVIGGGFRRGGVDLILTRPKGFKSTTALNCGLHLAKLGTMVLYLDTEMTKDSQNNRILSHLSSLDINTIESGSFGESKILSDKVIQAGKILKKLPFYHETIAGKSFEEILSIIRRWIVKEVGNSGGKTNNCLVLYDYFKLMSPDTLENMQEFQALGFQISKLTDYAKEYDFSCLSFCQLNRQGIDKDTSDIISQSDRLLWLCSSASFLRRKTQEEMIQDGVENGNLKLKTIECRFGSGLEDNNHINMQVNASQFQLAELNTKYDVVKKKGLIKEEESNDVDF